MNSPIVLTIQLISCLHLKLFHLQNICIRQVFPILKNQGNMGTLCITSKVLADTTFAPQNPLQTHTLLARHFTPQHSSLTRTLCFLACFIFWNTLLLGTLGSPEHIASWWLFLLKIICTLDHLKWSVPRNKVRWWGKCAKIRCKECWGVVFWGVECTMLLWSKVCASQVS